MPRTAALPAIPARPADGLAWPGHLRLVADAAWRLGPRACLLMGWHRVRLRGGVARITLRDTPLPAGPVFPAGLPAAPPDAAGAAGCAEAAAAAVAGGWHGPFDGRAEALRMDLFAPGDVRPVWERNRLLALPLLAMAARAAPMDGHLERAEALAAEWRAANPPFRGPAWACGQEAALRALHLCLALALLEADRSPPPAMRALLGVHARRIAATRAYAAAQDNNHSISEPAGLFVIGLVLGDAGMARRAARALVRAVARLVGQDGAFAQASPAYHRLLLDTLSLAEWFRQRHGAPPLAAPFAERARAATLWLHHVAPPGEPLPRIGAGDDSALADLSLCGPFDARGTLERAARLFCQASAGVADDPGCAWLGLRRPVSVLSRPAAWRSEGWLGARQGPLRILLRTGIPRGFRPAQADLLHLDVWQGDRALLRDGGTGAYNPPPGCAWWLDALGGSAGHNTIEFDGQAQMPRLSRFLFAQWPDCRALPDGAMLTDRHGRVHERRVRLGAAHLDVEDRVGGPFERLVLRWRLMPGAWRLDGHVARGPGLRLMLSADAALHLRLVRGWESPAYGEVVPVPVLEVAAAAPVSRIATLLEVG